jgi:hypothetical protein
LPLARGGAGWDETQPRAPNPHEKCQIWQEIWDFVRLFGHGLAVSLRSGAKSQHSLPSRTSGGSPDFGDQTLLRNQHGRRFPGLYRAALMRL